MDAQFQAMVAALHDIGFTEADQVKDFGYVIQGVAYLRRVHQGRFQYLSLVSYDGKFCEAVFESYLAEKNTRRPKTSNRKELERLGFIMTHGMLYRSLPEILAAVAAPPA